MLHLVGNLFELNVKLRCQKVKVTVSLVLLCLHEFLKNLYQFLHYSIRKYRKSVLYNLKYYNINLHIFMGLEFISGPTQVMECERYVSSCSETYLIQVLQNRCIFWDRVEIFVFQIFFIYETKIVDYLAFRLPKCVSFSLLPTKEQTNKKKKTS